MNRSGKIKALTGIMVLLLTSLATAYLLGGLTPAVAWPTTGLITSPSTPDGKAGWFKTKPLITLVPDTTAATTYYSWDTTSSTVTYTAPFYGPAGGERTLYFYSVDASGGVEPAAERVIKVDTAAPSLALSAPKNKRHIRGILRIRAIAADGGGSASGLKDIRIFTGRRLLASAGSTSLFSINTRRFTPGRRLFRITARDKAGNISLRRRWYVVDNARPKIPVAYVSPTVPSVQTPARLFFKVNDAVAPRLKVTTQIRKTDGKLLAEAALGWVARANLMSATLKMPDDEGTYLYRIFARDRAGNRRIRTVSFTVGNEWMLDNVKSHVFELSKNIGVRVEGTEGEHRAADYIEGRLKGYGYEVERQSFSLPDGKVSYNIVARRPGADPSQKFIVGAHYDSKSPSPGANDNGTGTGVVLELARQFKTKNLRPTMVFVLFGAEERFGVNRYPEHQGSQYFVGTMSEADRQSALGMISVDMVGVGTTFHVRSMRKGTMSLVNDILAFAGADNTAIGYAQDFGWSDHDQFELAGIPAAWLEWRNDPLFHTTQDVYERIQWDAVDITGRFLSRYLLARFKI